ncbi:MAG TPA: hypothetical protein PLD88_02580 [Candidatus Berkiella sp.]|nr:hypothetical protein [Candidatus Berkiella sp.]
MRQFFFRDMSNKTTFYHLNSKMTFKELKEYLQKISGYNYTIVTAGRVPQDDEEIGKYADLNFYYLVVSNAIEQKAVNNNHKDLLKNGNYQLHWAVIQYKQGDKPENIKLDATSFFSLTALPCDLGAEQPNATAAFQAFSQRVNKNKNNEQAPAIQANYKKEHTCLALVAVPNEKYLKTEPDHVFAGTKMVNLLHPNVEMGAEIQVTPLMGIVDENYGLFINNGFAQELQAEAFAKYKQALITQFAKNNELFFSRDEQQKNNQKESLDEGGFTKEAIVKMAGNLSTQLTEAQQSDIINFVKTSLSYVENKESPVFLQALQDISSNKKVNSNISADVLLDINEFNLSNDQLHAVTKKQGDIAQVRRFFNACLSRVVFVIQTQLINKEKAADANLVPVEMPQKSVVAQPKPSIVIALDHGGVLDGDYCFDESELGPNGVMLHKMDFGGFMGLKDGKRILSILKELSDLGCIITSHSANKLEDQQQLVTHIKNAASKLGLEIPFQLGVIGDKEQVRRGLREIHKVADPKNLFVFDDSSEAIQEAAKEGCTTFYITANANGITLVTALEKTLQNIKARALLPNEANAMLQQAAPANAHQQKIDEIVALTLDEQCPEAKLRVLLNEQHANMDAILSKTIIGKPLLFSVFDKLSDNMAVGRLLTFINHVPNPDVILNQQNGQGLTLEDVANFNGFEQTAAALQQYKLMNQFKR